MAPEHKADVDLIQEGIKHVIEDLYSAMVQVHAYDTSGRPGGEVLENTLKDLSASIQAVHAHASKPHQALPDLPLEVIGYVDNGRNPDIYTREFVEGMRKQNQLMKGKQHAFADFRDVLAREMSLALPELADDVARVCENTGGPALEESAAGKQRDVESQK